MTSLRNYRNSLSACILAIIWTSITSSSFCGLADFSGTLNPSGWLGCPSRGSHSPLSPAGEDRGLCRGLSWGVNPRGLLLLALWWPNFETKEMGSSEEPESPLSTGAVSADGSWEVGFFLRTNVFVLIPELEPGRTSTQLWVSWSHRLGMICTALYPWPLPQNRQLFAFGVSNDEIYKW